MKKVTIAMPTRNGLKLLDRAIESAVNQTWENLEILISDNASTPETAIIWRKWADKDSRITCIRKTYLIPAIDNFEVGLRSAFGDCFMWLADDN